MKTGHIEIAHEFSELESLLETDFKTFACLGLQSRIRKNSEGSCIRQNISFGDRRKTETLSDGSTEPGRFHHSQIRTRSENGFCDALHRIHFKMFDAHTS